MYVLNAVPFDYYLTGKSNFIENINPNGIRIVMRLRECCKIIHNILNMELWMDTDLNAIFSITY